MTKLAGLGFWRAKRAFMRPAHKVSPYETGQDAE